MPYEYALVTQRYLAREELSRAIESLGERVTLTLMRGGEFAMLTDASDARICTLYASQILRLHQVQGYGRIPEGARFWSDLTLHSSSGGREYEYVERLADQLDGALLAPVMQSQTPVSGEMADQPSGFPPRSPKAWKPRANTLRVKGRHLRDFSYAEANATYDFATLPTSSILAEPEVLWDAASNQSVPDRIALVNSLLDRGAQASYCHRDGRNVLHVLFSKLRGDVAQQLPMIRRLVDEGAEVNQRDSWRGRPLDELASNRALSDDAAKPLYDYLFDLDPDILTPSLRGRSPYQSIVRNGGFRVLLRERCEDYLAGKGLAHKVIVNRTTLETVGSRGLAAGKTLPRLRTVTYGHVRRWLQKICHATELVRRSEVDYLEQEHREAGFTLTTAYGTQTDDADDPVLARVSLTVSDPVSTVPELSAGDDEEVLARAFQRLTIMIEGGTQQVELIGRTKRSMTWRAGEMGRVELLIDEETIKLDLHFGGYPMRFHDHYVSREHRFSLGEEETGQRFYLAFPVSNGIVDYEEHYLLSAQEYQQFLANPELALPLLERCRSRDEDGRLLERPGWNRGAAL